MGGNKDFKFCLLFCCNFLNQVWSGPYWTNNGKNYADKCLLRKSLWSTLFHSRTVSLLQVYKAINIYVALIGLEIWTDNDKCSLSPIAGSTLDSFSKWRNSDLLKRKRNDNAQLITYVLLLFLLWSQSSWVSQRLQCSLTTQRAMTWSLKAAGKCRSSNPKPAFTLLFWLTFIGFHSSKHFIEQFALNQVLMNGNVIQIKKINKVYLVVFWFALLLRISSNTVLNRGWKAELEMNIYFEILLG